MHLPVELNVYLEKYLTLEHTLAHQNPVPKYGLSSWARHKIGSKERDQSIEMGLELARINSIVEREARNRSAWLDGEKKPLRKSRIKDKRIRRVCTEGPQTSQHHIEIDNSHSEQNRRMQTAQAVYLKHFQQINESKVEPFPTQPTPQPPQMHENIRENLSPYPLTTKFLQNWKQRISSMDKNRKGALNNPRRKYEKQQYNVYQSEPINAEWQKIINKSNTKTQDVQQQSKKWMQMWKKRCMGKRSMIKGIGIGISTIQSSSPSDSKKSSRSITLTSLSHPKKYIFAKPVNTLSLKPQTHNTIS